VHRYSLPRGVSTNFDYRFALSASDVFHCKVHTPSGSWETVYFHPYFQTSVGGLIGTGADTLTFCHSADGFQGFYRLDDIVVITSPATPK